MSLIAERLNDAPVNRRHWRITIVIGLGLFFDLFDVFLAGVLSTVLTKSFGVTQSALPLVLGSSFLGMFVGSICMGAAADRFGRRPAFLTNLAIYSLFTLAGSLSPNATVLIVTRFLAGIGIGAQLPLSDAYLSEMLPTRARGRLISIAYTVGFLGVPAVGFTARLLVPLVLFGAAGWRWLFAAGSLGGICVWILQRYLVESPRWLESAGRSAKARNAAAALLGISADTIRIGAAIESPRPPYATLFARAHRRRTLMLYVFQIFQTVGYYGFGTLAPLVLASKGFTVLQSLTYTTIAFLGYPIGSALSVFVVERMDRRLLIMLSALAMAICGLTLGLAAAPALIAAMGILYTLVSNFFSNAFHIFQAEIFSTAIRGRAAGSAYGLSRLSSAAMPFVLLPILHNYGPGVMFAAVAGAMLIVILDIGLFAPRTTGRNLEQIAVER